MIAFDGDVYVLQFEGVGSAEGQAAHIRAENR